MNENCFDSVRLHANRKPQKTRRDRQANVCPLDLRVNFPRKLNRYRVNVVVGPFNVAPKPFNDWAAKAKNASGCANRLI
jgi:hypothetical protein